ncbi:unnamed protein product [Closterium sp. NIES-54]
MAHCDMAWRGVAMAWHGVAWRGNGVAWHGMMWRGVAMVRHGMAWHGVAWRGTRYLTSQRQDSATLYAHASGALQAPPRPEPLPAVPPPTPEAQADYTRFVLARNIWDSRDAAATLALTELLPPTEAAHFDLVETAKEVYDAIYARYSTPSSASLSRILIPFVFPDLGSFATVSDLATQLRSLVASYRAACTEAQLLVAPPPIWLTVHWVVTRLPDRLSTVRDTLLQQHPNELTIDLLETTLGKIESNLLSVASAIDTVAPRRNGAREARKGGRGVAAVEAALWAAVVAVAVVHQAEGDLEEVLTRLLEKVRPAVVHGPSSGSHSRDSSSCRDSSSGRHHSSFSHGDPHCNGVRSSTGVLRHSGDLEDPGARAAAAALPPGPLAPRGMTPAPTTTGACVASEPDTPLVEASLSFTLDSGASQCFFRDHTTLTPLLAPVPVALADPSSGPAIARSSTTLLCPVVPSGVLRGLHIPSFTRNLVGVGYLQDRGITVTFVGGGRIAVCTDAATSAVLATFTKESHSGLYVLHIEHSPVASFVQVAASPQVPVSSPVVVSGQVEVAASCSCRSLAHPTVLWHHRLGHLSLPCLRSMASHSLVSGLPRVFLSLPSSLAPPCSPCVASRLRATPHSSLRPATAPFQTLHLDIWGPAPTLGHERERYFIVVVDDCSRYTTVFSLAKKSEVTSTLIRWLLATEGTRGSRVRCLHSDHGGEFRSGILAGFCGEQGIKQSWMLQESP